MQLKVSDPSHIVMDELDALIGIAASYMGVLTPAHAIIQQIWASYSSIKFARAKCKNVIRRAALVIKTIRDSNGLHGIAVESMERLNEKLEDVQIIMQKQASMSFFKALLRFDEINSEIELAHQHISDCLQLFQIDILLAHMRVQDSKDKESSARADRKMLEEVLSRITGRYDKVLSQLSIHGPEEEDEAMAAMEKTLRTTNLNSEGTIEREILQRSLECIKVSTGRSAPKQSKWTITRHELDFGETIGGGGFSTVTKAEFRGTTVAVKLVKDIGKDTLEQEIEIWSELRHPHIVPFYGASILSSPPYIVSRYMKHGNLIQYLSRKPRTNRMKLLYEISLGMRFLHGQNVVHGDLKGVNVLVDDAGKACITDFGLSKARNLTPAESNTRMIAGTLRFLAPEALRGQPLTFETDVYAFGMVVYEIFAGQIPFILEPDHLIMQGCLELKRPTSNEVYERGLDDILWSLLSSCISRDPRQRPKFATIQGSLQSMKSLNGPSSSQGLDPAMTRLTEKTNMTGTFVQSMNKGASSSQEREPAMMRWKEGAATTRTLVNSTPQVALEDKSPVNDQSGPPSRRSIVYDINKLDPIYGDVTVTYIDVGFGLSKQREPAVYLEEDHTFRWLPVHPLKGSFLRADDKRLTCMSSLGVGQITWELDANDVVYKSPAGQSAVCRFPNAQSARRWFELQVGYARNGSVDGWGASNVRGDWSTTKGNWQRVVGGKLQRAAAIEHSSSLVPSQDWSTVDMPKRCLVDNDTGSFHSFSCTVNPGSPQASEWRFKIQGRTLTSETYRHPGDRNSIIVRKEVFLGDEEAEMMFNVMKAALGKVASSKGKWFRW